MNAFKRGKSNFPFKAVGIAAMAVGALILIFCVPGWFWTTLIGILLIAAGFLMWRFCV